MEHYDSDKIVDYGLFLSFEQAQIVSFVSLYDTENTKKEQIFSYFEQLWNRSENLYSCLINPVDKSIPNGDVRPILFYFGYPSCVIFGKLAKKKLISKDNFVKLKYDLLMESNLFRWMDIDDKKLSIGQKKKCHLSENQSNFIDVCYMRKVSLLVMREAIMNYSDNYANNYEIKTKETCCHLNPNMPEWAILMSIEHTHLSLEMQVNFIRHLPIRSINMNVVAQLSLHFRRSPIRSSLAQIPKNRMILLQSSIVPWLGLRVEVEKSTEEFENLQEEEIERAKRRADARRTCRQSGCRKEVNVKKFWAARFKVSNGEFFAFMQDGGYAQERYWSSDGWLWRIANNITHPKWWIRRGQDEQEFLLRDTLEEIEMPWDWPVEVSLWEVEAFLGWKNASSSQVDYQQQQQPGKFRLPTEAEHILFSGRTQELDPLFERAIYHGSDKGWQCPFSNLDWKYHSASPVDLFPPSITGINDAAGNLWEWVIDDAPPSTDPDRKTTTTTGSHALVGGCWASSGDPATSARYNAGGITPGRGTLLQFASFRYVSTFNNT